MTIVYYSFHNSKFIPLISLHDIRGFLKKKKKLLLKAFRIKIKSCVLQKEQHFKNKGNKK